MSQHDMKEKYPNIKEITGITTRQIMGLVFQLDRQLGRYSTLLEHYKEENEKLKAEIKELKKHDRPKTKK